MASPIVEVECEKEMIKVQRPAANWLSSTVARAVFEIFGADIINVRELDFLNSKIPNFKILNSTIQIPNGCFLKTTNLSKTYKKYIFFVK